jgi:DNA-directed RNA polymerase specialized sigma24 family protein
MSHRFANYNGAALMAAPGFPGTRHSVIASLGSEQPDVRRAAFDALATAYWKPVFKYIRLKWSATPDEAADVTQAFFLRAYEKAYFAGFDPARGRFRTYLRTCLDRFVANVRQENRRLKRGGAIEFVPFDFAAAESELQRQHIGDAVQELDAFFHREWLRSLFGLAVDRLRVACERGGHARRVAIFERYDLADDESTRPTYAVLASELGINVTDVTNELAAARRDFRRVVLEVLREQCATDDEFENEARALGSPRDL